MEEEEDVLEEDQFQLARSYFDMKEFDRVAHTLREARGDRARFLRTYAAYLVSFQSRVQLGSCCSRPRRNDNASVAKRSDRQQPLQTMGSSR